MPHVEIAIGGRTFEVACQEGEEHFLHSAAAMLNDEASHMSAQIGRMPEARMLLMAGLMLADKTAISTQVEVAVIPTSVTDAMALIAARTEALAAEVERRVG
jgi:cell division protein ZapA